MLADRVPSWALYQRANEAEREGRSVLAKKLRDRADVALVQELTHSLREETKVPCLDHERDARELEGR